MATVRHPARDTSQERLEASTWRAGSAALASSLIAIPLLAIPADFIADHRLAVVTAHLTIVVLAASWLAFRLVPLLRHPWFAAHRHGLLLSAVSLIALVTGYAALVTLATSAALRYDPSLQFLQLLSALDVAWSATAVGIGVILYTGSKRAGVIAALVLDAICVWSIWNYLRVVGFDVDGGWLVSRSDLLTLVIPFDVAAAGVAITALFAGSRRHERNDG